MRACNESPGRSIKSTTPPTPPASKAAHSPPMDRPSLASVAITRTTALYPTAVFVQWDIFPEESGDHLVDLFRSGGPNGPWEPVALSLANAYQYLDSHFNLPPPPRSTDIREGLHFFSLARDVYYRVTVTPPSGPANQFSSMPTPVEPDGGVTVTR